ncbi:MAG TPA: dipeptide epimerase [Chitinophagaceae bacterium]|nr:MAG: Muconate cycloisomerase [Bacteroidetes bacterium OLB11]HMN32023.1 dipeptide epimerase [Chitinophagaceae bacterium]
MLHFKYKKINTEFKHPFTTAYGTKTHQEAFLVAITFNGVTGFGEAPAIKYYDVSVEKMENDLLEKIELLQTYTFNEPPRFWHFCEHLFEDNPFLVCALDIAYWDLYSKYKRKKIYELLNIEWKKTPYTNYTLGYDTIEKQLKKINQNPMPIYKIKVGNENDMEVLRAVRNHTQSTIRIDANASWTLQFATQILPELEAMKIELIEQPFTKDAYDDTKTFANITNIPIIADEACVTHHDIIRCIGCYDGINIKLTKCGGITPAFDMIKEAKANHLKVMMGNMNETEIGSYAIAQFLPLLDYVDLDGPLLLNTPPLKRLAIQDGAIQILN